MKSVLMHRATCLKRLSFRYFGPIDGHDVLHLAELLQDMKSIPGPKLLHILTVKGKGFPLAEMNQTVYHAPGKFNRETGELVSSVMMALNRRYTRMYLDSPCLNLHGPTTALLESLRPCPPDVH